MQSTAICLWFDTQAEAAARFYCSVFPNSRILEIAHYAEGGRRPEGEVLTVRFALDGVEYVAINGGPEFTFSPAISVMAFCETQAEVDRVWDALVEGGRPVQCGWLTDRYGLSWQVLPRSVLEMLNSSDRKAAARAWAAVMTMVRIDVAAVERAYSAAG